jgi:hypothetical protein
VCSAAAIAVCVVWMKAAAEKKEREGSVRPLLGLREMQLNDTSCDARIL